MEEQGEGGREGGREERRSKGSKESGKRRTKVEGREEKKEGNWSPVVMGASLQPGQNGSLFHRL